MHQHHHEKKVLANGRLDAVVVWTDSSSCSSTTLCLAESFDPRRPLSHRLLPCVEQYSFRPQLRHRHEIDGPDDATSDVAEFVLSVVDEDDAPCSWYFVLEVEHEQEQEVGL